ncbi:MAG: cbb3-type cytochrome oxidase assembly protein CcoS [Cellvibrio sp.]|uniref:cbb3-type cytochrome oxidase assembly protein CcoS n=1 Tax=Cellvibrio sp. TaxID=1965322 RepID=UPI0027248CF5|nr:cbb3-type cytochrome oxidase assembly protein CcoS [Cellvibrio sp.]
MESLYFLVPCALIFIGIAIKVLFWAINNGQYDNLDTEAHRILFDADETKKVQPPTAAETSDDTSDNTFHNKNGRT